MSLYQMQLNAERNSKRWFDSDSTIGEWGSNAHLSFLCTALAEELGEVAGPIKKLIRDGKPLPDDHHHELADVLTYLMLLASALGYDLQNAHLEKVAINDKRFG